MPRLKIALVAFIAVVGRTSTLAADEAGDQFFEKSVRPILVEHCAKCHGDEKPKGKLRLTSKSNLLTGGESGPAAVPGKPAESLIVEAISYRDEPKMPPKGKLADADIAILTKWIEMGLPWPEAKAAAPTTLASALYVISDEQRNFWAFRPVRPVPPPAVKDPSWPRGDIDRFLLSTLESKGLRPAPKADKRTLIRRATFDLTGLPPTPKEIDDFLKDPAPDAFSRVVDRLLASPAYGERWGRHWLDVVRYADSLDSRGVGQPGDILDAWRYRDWVAEALNADMPYDKFVRYQIAGDLLPPRDSSEGAAGFNRSGTIATTMLAIGNWGNGDADKEKILTDIADDQVDVVSKAFLGLTVSCARCHDHKFDPIPTKDYYGLAGIFFSTHILPKLTPKGAGETIIRVSLDSPADSARRKAHADALAAIEKDLRDQTAREYAEFAATLEPESPRYLVALWEYQNRPTNQSSPSLAEFAAARGLLPFVLRQWSDALGMGGGTLLEAKVPEIQANPGIKAWNGPPQFGSVTANQTNQAQQVLTFRLPPRSIAMHPGPSSGVAVRWTSPITGSFRIGGRVADADPRGGDGILWFLDQIATIGGRELASGSIPDGGAMAFGQGKGADSLGSVAVRAGEAVQLTIMPRGNHTCDTTTVELTISSWSDATTWDLTRDVLDDFHSGNPHSDRLGHPGVWRFLDLGTKERPTLLTAQSGPAAAWVSAMSSGDRNRLESAAAELARSLPASDARSPLRIRSPADEAALPPERRERLAQLRARLEQHRRAAPTPVEFANAAQDGGVPESSQAGFHDVKVHARGRYDRLGELVPRHFPAILGGTPDAGIKSGSGRKELAEWITRPENPLIARVMVNRIWQHHFGEGIVRTPSNFGKLGDRPSHPELLDYLASQLTTNGWSLKTLHSQIMLSATYQQSSVCSPDALAADPENRLFGRMNRRRLEAEIIRDNLLSVSGRLDPRTGGPPERDFNVPRRGLYMMTIRSDRSNFGALFDQADSTAPVDRRNVTTVAPQSLFMLNNSFVLDQSRTFADRISRESPSDDYARLDLAYLLLFGRPALDSEHAIAGRFLDRAEQRGDPAGDAWASYAHILMCSNEFLYID